MQTLQLFRSRSATRAYLPNSPWNAGASAPSAWTLPGHEALAVSMGTRKQHTEGFTRCSQRHRRASGGGTGAVGQPQSGPLPRHAQTAKARMGTNIFKIRWGGTNKQTKKIKKKKSSFHLQTGQTMKQHFKSDRIPPLPILPIPAAGATGTIAAGG